MTPTMQAIIAALAGKRFPLEHEKQTQNSIWDALRFAQNDGRLARALRIEREVRIVAGIIDFVEFQTRHEFVSWPRRISPVPAI